MEHESVESLRRWLREKEDENRRLRALLLDWDRLVLRGNATSTADIEEWTLRVQAELARG